MGHDYAVTTSAYCRIASKVRSHVFEDADLVDGNLEFYLEWAGGYIEPWFGQDAGTLLNTQPLGIGGLGSSWTDPSSRFRANGAGGITSNFAGGQLQQNKAAGVDPWVSRTAVIDVSFTVTVGTSGAGVELRGNNGGVGFTVYPNVATSQVRVRKIVSGGTTTFPLSGGTIAQGGTYTIRVTADSSDNWVVYLDGASIGSFTDAAMNTQKIFAVVFFDTTSVVSNLAFQPTSTCPATSYEVINGAGAVVASGAVSGYKILVPDSALEQRNGRGPYGDYKLRLFGASSGNYGTAKGNCEFLRVPTDARFAAKPAAFTTRGTPGSSSQYDVGLRSFFGLGATRLPYNEGTPATIAAYLKTNYVDAAFPSRPRHIIGHFQDGEDDAAVTAFVNANKASIDAWEPRNEPSSHTSPADFVAEQAAFYAAVKAADPDAIVLGPNPVTYNSSSGGLPWISSFLALGGADYLDGLSVHGYNCTSGIIALARETLADLKTLADQYDLPLWQTEQSHFSQYGNLYLPASNAVPWIAVQLMAQEAGGIPIERNVLWYDVAHGFIYSSLWGNGTGNTAVPLVVRTMVAEIGDRTFDSQYDLGGMHEFYIANKWVGEDGSATVGVLAQSVDLPNVRFYLTGAETAECCDGYGNEFTLTRGASNIVSVPTAEVPTWVKLPAGADLTLVASDWVYGTNRAPDGTTTTSSVSGVTNVANLTDGDLHNNGVTAPYFTINDYAYDGSPYPTHTITHDLGALVDVGRVVLAAPIPWQTGFSVPTDFDIDVSVDEESWTTVLTQSPDASTTSAFVSDLTGSNTTVDQWFCPANTWTVDVNAAAQYVRLVIRDISYGGHETQAASEALWGAGVYEKRLNLRSLRVYEQPAGDPDRPRFNLTVTCSG